jgi:hypothetical protein
MGRARKLLVTFLPGLQFAGTDPGTAITELRGAATAAAPAAAGIAIIVLLVAVMLLIYRLRRPTVVAEVSSQFTTQDFFIDDDELNQSALPEASLASDDEMDNLDEAGQLAANDSDDGWLESRDYSQEIHVE